MELDRETFKKLFPNLAREMDLEESRVSLNALRTEKEDGDKASSSGMFVNYNPDVIDFIRRCDTEEKAEEIIAFMEKRGEIKEEYAKKLRKQLKEKGVRSFGSKKEDNYYLKRAGLF